MSRYGRVAAGMKGNPVDWLLKPIERLDDRRPIDVIRIGQYRRVSRLVTSLEGMPFS